MTHEEYLSAIREHVATRLDPDLAAVVRNVKLVYGLGLTARGTVKRGVTVFNAWKQTRAHVDVVEIAAAGEQDPVQLAGTTLHELAHVIAGPDAGHGPGWREVAEHLGLHNARAANQAYQLSEFLDAGLRQFVASVRLLDGSPELAGRLASRVGVPPCSAGIGSRGGRSRGAGSGSRQVLHVCPCGVRIRAARSTFKGATCNACRGQFR